MNNAFTGQPLKTYEMLPIKRPDGWKPTIKHMRPTPSIGSQTVLVHYRVFGLDPSKLTADIAADAEGNAKRTVNVAMLGPSAIHVGDILGYEANDTSFARPKIAHRFHQRHQHPKHLVARNEVSTL